MTEKTGTRTLLLTVKAGKLEIFGRIVGNMGYIVFRKRSSKRICHEQYFSVDGPGKMKTLGNSRIWTIVVYIGRLSYRTDGTFHPCPCHLDSEIGVCNPYTLHPTYTHHSLWSYGFIGHSDLFGYSLQIQKTFTNSPLRPAFLLDHCDWTAWTPLYLTT